jgi:hypothetical protein
MPADLLMVVSIAFENVFGTTKKDPCDVLCKPNVVSNTPENVFSTTKSISQGLRSGQT